MQSAQHSMSEEPPAFPEDMYEGNVILRVEALRSNQEMVRFVNALRENPYLQFIRLDGNRQENVGVWLRLPTPMPLKKVLLQMEDVSQVADSCWLEPGGAAEQGLDVRLVQVSSPN